MLKLKYEKCFQKDLETKYSDLIKRTGEILAKKCDKITAIILQVFSNY